MLATVWQVLLILDETGTVKEGQWRGLVDDNNRATFQDIPLFKDHILSYLEIVWTVLPDVDMTIVDTIDDIQDCLPEWVSMGLVDL